MTYCETYVLFSSSLFLSPLEQLYPYSHHHLSVHTLFYVSLSNLWFFSCCLSLPQFKKRAIYGVQGARRGELKGVHGDTLRDFNAPLWPSPPKGIHRCVCCRVIPQVALGPGGENTSVADISAGNICEQACKQLFKENICEQYTGGVSNLYICYYSLFV